MFYPRLVVLQRQHGARWVASGLGTVATTVPSAAGRAYNVALIDCDEGFLRCYEPGRTSTRWTSRSPARRFRTPKSRMAARNRPTRFIPARAGRPARKFRPRRGAAATVGAAESDLGHVADGLLIDLMAGHVRAGMPRSNCAIDGLATTQSRLGLNLKRISASHAFHRRRPRFVLHVPRRACRGGPSARAVQCRDRLWLDQRSAGRRQASVREITRSRRRHASSRHDSASTGRCRGAAMGIAQPGGLGEAAVRY